MADEKEAFEALIKADKYDEQTRRVFADYLEEHGFDDEASFQRKWTRAWQEAEDWFAWFAEQINEDEVPPTVEEVVAAGTRYVESGETITIGGGLGFGATNLWDEVAGDYWRHWQAYTGRTLEEKEAGEEHCPFSCCFR